MNDTDTPQASAHKNVICEKCGKRMLIEVSGETREYRCPVCKATFHASLNDGELSVRFD